MGIRWNENQRASNGRSSLMPTPECGDKTSAETHLSRSPAEETGQASQLPSPRPANGSLSSCFLCFSLSGVTVTCPGEGRMGLRTTGNTLTAALLWGCTPTLLLLTLHCPLDNLCFIVLNLCKLLSFKTGVCSCN